MITGEIKTRIDQIWDTFWTGGITNSITILEQMTYLFFMKMLDDAQRTKEANASVFGATVQDPTFKEGMWHNPDTDRDVPYSDLRWSVFKSMEAEQMYRTVSRDVFAFIKNLSGGKESAYSKFMANATFLIQSPRTLVKVVEGIDALGHELPGKRIEVKETGYYHSWRTDGMVSQQRTFGITKAYSLYKNRHIQLDLLLFDSGFWSQPSKPTLLNGGFAPRIAFPNRLPLNGVCRIDRYQWPVHIERRPKVSIAKIVMSSDWRIAWPGSRIRLEKSGFPEDLIIDKTPELIWRMISREDYLRGDSAGFCYQYSRGREIDLWLEAHPECTNYAIPDDRSDFTEEQGPHFVHFNPKVGITDEDVDIAIMILNYH